MCFFESFWPIQIHPTINSSSFPLFFFAVFLSIFSQRNTKILSSFEITSVSRQEKKNSQSRGARRRRAPPPKCPYNLAFMAPWRWGWGSHFRTPPTPWKQEQFFSRGGDWLQRGHSPKMFTNVHKIFITTAWRWDDPSKKKVPLFVVCAEGQRKGLTPPKKKAKIFVYASRGVETVTLFVQKPNMGWILRLPPEGVAKPYIFFLSDPRGGGEIICSLQKTS